MTPAQFAAAWGADTLQRPSPAGIAAAGLFPESARFLSQAGLPATADRPRPCAACKVLRKQIARIDAPALAADACWGQTIASRIEPGGLSEA